MKKLLFILLGLASAPLLIGVVLSIVEYFQPRYIRCDGGRNG